MIIITGNILHSIVIALLFYNDKQTFIHYSGVWLLWLRNSERASLLGLLDKKLRVDIYSNESRIINELLKNTINSYHDM